MPLASSMLAGKTLRPIADRAGLRSGDVVVSIDDTAIKTVARSLGFTDSSHFHHAFVAQYGVTPAQYRAACFADK